MPLPPVSSSARKASAVIVQGMHRIPQSLDSAPLSATQQLIALEKAISRSVPSQQALLLGSTLCQNEECNPDYQVPRRIRRQV